MTEAEVVRRTHRFLNSSSIGQHFVVRLYTDAHSTLLPDRSLKPFQRFFLDLGDMVFHPDLVGQLSDGECIFAVESKGTADMLKGLAQAEVYQAGFHYSFLSAHASAWTDSLVGFARQKNIGVISVGDEFLLPFVPEARMPWREPFQGVFRQMKTVVQVSDRQTFLFNLPTHYLAWCIVLDHGVGYHSGELKNLLPAIQCPMIGEEPWLVPRNLGWLQSREQLLLSPTSDRP